MNQIVLSAPYIKTDREYLAVFSDRGVTLTSNRDHPWTVFRLRPVIKVCTQFSPFWNL